MSKTYLKGSWKPIKMFLIYWLIFGGYSRKTEERYWVSLYGQSNVWTETIWLTIEKCA